MTCNSQVLCHQNKFYSHDHANNYILQKMQTAVELKLRLQQHSVCHFLPVYTTYPCISAKRDSL